MPAAFPLRSISPIGPTEPYLSYLPSKKMRRYTLFILALLALFTSCGDTDYEFSTNRCYFIFENNGPRSTALASAMNPMSPGIFCRITTSGEDYYIFTSNQGLTDRVVRNAIDKQRTVELGVYNETGIIVGYGNLNNPATFYAYDSQCPNCYRNTNLPRYSLTINSDGTAECGSCHRKYDMNNGGIVSAGDGGAPMMQYRNARTTGPQGVLSVSN